MTVFFKQADVRENSVGAVNINSRFCGRGPAARGAQERIMNYYWPQSLVWEKK